MDCRVGWILELLRHEVLRIRIGQLLGLGDGSTHALRTRGEDQLSAIAAQEHAAFDAHGLRHGQHDLDAASCTHHCQRNAGVATGGLDDHRVWAYQASLLSGVDHRKTDAVLHRVRWIEELQLRSDGCPCPVCDVSDLHQWGVADQFSDVIGDSHGQIMHAYHSPRKQTP